ncbi:MAG: DUF5011 domain-containing protein, partial [Clostridiales bacterium]|nr:DUF5011 domain-containing protein [Clostridiales bacterium]
VNTATAGTYVITYNVRDAAGNAATEVTRTVIVAEPIRVIAIYVSPSVILTSTASFPTTVQVIIYPENATNKNVVWSSSNTSAVTVEDGEVTLLDVDFRGIMTIRATTIDGNKAATVFVSSLSAADTHAFWVFNEVFRGDRFDSLDLTNEEDFRSIEYLLNSVHFDRMAAALPNVDGKDAFLERFISFRTEVNAARLTFNTLQIETAQELIAGASYTMTQETATDEAIIKSTIEGIIESEISAINSYYEITTTVNQVDYAPAVAGNAENPAGVNGTYTFTVDVSNSTATGSTATLTMTIIATPFADRP